MGLVKGGYAALGCQAQVVPFIDDMATALARADLLVARSGAMTVSEVALAGRPAIFVPYPFHRDRQQELNARVLERRGAAVIVADDERLGENLAATLRELIADPARLVRMAAQARTAAKPDAARTIAQLCFEAWLEGARSRMSEPLAKGLLSRQRRLAFHRRRRRRHERNRGVVAAARLRGERMRFSASVRPPSGLPRWACRSSRAIILITLRITLPIARRPTSLITSRSVLTPW